MTDDELRKLLADATQGPWNDDGDAQAWSEDGYARACVDIGGASWWSPQPEDADEMCLYDANARLLAAAPALAAEVLKLREVVRGILEWVPGEDNRRAIRRELGWEET